MQNLSKMINKKTFFTVICFAVLPAVSFAYDVQIDGIYYDVDSTNKTATLTNTEYEISGAVVIPEAINYNGTQYMVTSIGEDAFLNREDVTSVTIPNSVTSIGKQAFSSCDGLTSVTIPNSVTYIDNGAFSFCSELTHVNFNAEKCSYMGSFSQSNGWGYVFERTALKSLTIGDKVTAIPPCAFAWCSGLASVTIPNSVTTIGNDAFDGCSGLTSVTIPNSVTSIGARAFSHCERLTSMIIPNSVTSIEADVFSYCSGLTSVTIPNSVTTIGDGAFYGCSGLTSVTIPNSVTAIGRYAFYVCKELASVSIPQKVESVGESAFENCTGLTAVTIEGSEVLLAAETFVGCTNIKTVNTLSTLPPIGADNTFELITYRDATLNVPKTAKDAYSKPACWRNFRHVEEKDFGGVDDVTADEGGICVNVRDGLVEVSGADASEEIRVYDMSGMEIYRGTDRTIALPTKGVYIVKVAGRTFKVAL